LAVQDDACTVVWIDPKNGVVEPWVLDGHGGALAKADKPDFEAAFVEGPYIYVVGSGSKPNRRTIARLDPGAGTARLNQLDALYAAVEEALGGVPNLEGAAIVGDVLRLFHRGNGDDQSAWIDVSRRVLEGGAARVRAMERCDLGRVGDVALGFTDAVPYGSGALYLAVAEDTPNAIDDGPIVGGAVGVITGASARYALLEDENGAISTRKAEGIAMDSPTTGWLITDPDDPARSAELCRLELQGAWGG
jgi:hypothetical protein